MAKAVKTIATVINKDPAKTLPPKTTIQEDLTTSGQRRINLIWELTQATIAVMITAAVVVLKVKKIESDVLDNAFLIIITMYFVRTNHRLIGGTGTKTGTR